MKATKAWLAGALFGFGIMMSACSGGDGATAPSSTDLVGKWYLRQAVSKGSMSMKPTGGQAISIPLDTTLNYTGTANYMDLKADNTYEANMPESEIPDFGFEKRAAAGLAALETGTWSLNGSNLTLISNVGPGNPVKDTLTQRVSVDGNTLTVVFSMEESTSDAEGSFSIDLDVTSKLSKTP